MKLIYPAIALDHSNPVTNENQIGNYLIKSFYEFDIKSEVVFYKNNYIKFLFGFKKLFYNTIKKQNYLISREPLFLKFLNRKINKTINQSDADFIFSFGTNPVAYLETTKPIFILADATFNNLLNRYDKYNNLPPQFIEESHKLEKIAFEKAKLIFFSSKFAINDAIQFYGVSPNKLVQVPLGANIDNFPKENEINSIIQNRLNDSLHLLMIGKEWHRKGFDIGIEIFEKINKQIKNANLTIIGCEPPNNILNSKIRIIKNINKSIKTDLEMFEQIMEKSHILLFPSRAEAFGHVISEANAYGIPVIANNVGGIPSVIEEGLNGYLFDLNKFDGIELALNRIIELYNKKGKYKELSLNSYRIYSSKLNWKTIVKTIILNIEKYLKQ